MAILPVTRAETAVQVMALSGGIQCVGVTTFPLSALLGGAVSARADQEMTPGFSRHPGLWACC